MNIGGMTETIRRSPDGTTDAVRHQSTHGPTTEVAQ